MFIVISYDITDNRVRTRLAKKLKNYGPRVQKYGVEAEITPGEWAELLELLANVPLEKEDSIRLYRLCEECRKKTMIWGKGSITEDKEYYIV